MRRFGRRSIQARDPPLLNELRLRLLEDHGVVELRRVPGAFDVPRPRGLHHFRLGLRPEGNPLLVSVGQWSGDSGGRARFGLRID